MSCHLSPVSVFTQSWKKYIKISPLSVVVGNFYILLGNMLMVRIVQHVSIPIKCLAVKLSNFPPLSSVARFLYIFSTYESFLLHAGGVAT